MQESINIFWFRRDLRLEDNAGLYHALKADLPTLPVFIFDKNILEKLPKEDKRVVFIHQNIERLKSELGGLGSDILVAYDTPLSFFRNAIEEYDIVKVYTNHDYEPYAKERDEEVKKILKDKGIELLTFKDQCIFEKKEILTESEGKPYKVFTPYSRKWKEKADDFYLRSYPNEKYFSNFLDISGLDMPSLERMGFEDIKADFPEKSTSEKVIKNYKERRNFPHTEGTTRIGVHLRFGTVSIRKLARKAKALNETWLNELIWRDFYMMILANHPRVVKDAFKPKYDNIPWRNEKDEFEAWQKGKTGYPIVDAGMRELNQSGYMHNRVRMITASFLTKHLLIDWRWGEAYFAEKLLDFELSSNNGGWQWAAGSGCDAAPYFRIFNPETQTKKFDKDHKYIKTWIPEFGTSHYPEPIVEHKFARERALETYKKALD